MKLVMQFGMGEYAYMHLLVLFLFNVRNTVYAQQVNPSDKFLSLILGSGSYSLMYVCMYVSIMCKMVNSHTHTHTHTTLHRCDIHIQTNGMAVSGFLFVYHADSMNKLLCKISSNITKMYFLF